MIHHNHKIKRIASRHWTCWCGARSDEPCSSPIVRDRDALRHHPDVLETIRRHASRISDWNLIYAVQDVIGALPPDDRTRPQSATLLVDALEMAAMTGEGAPRKNISPGRCTSRDVTGYPCIGHLGHHPPCDFSRVLADEVAMRAQVAAQLAETTDALLAMTEIAANATRERLALEQRITALEQELRTAVSMARRNDFDRAAVKGAVVTACYDQARWLSPQTITDLADRIAAALAPPLPDTWRPSDPGRSS